MNNDEIKVKYARECAELGDLVHHMIQELLKRSAAINALEAQHRANEAAEALQSVQIADPSNPVS